MDFERAGRPIHRCTKDFGLSERVLYSESAPPSYKNYLLLSGLLACNPCLVAQSEEVRNSTYVTVYENKVETNNPIICCCYGADRVAVHYFDRDEFLKVEKSGCCKPRCTHNCCCSTCFDWWGEELILYGSPFFSKRKNMKPSCAYPFCICKSWTSIYPLKDAKEVMQIIKQAHANSTYMIKMQRRKSSPHSIHSPRHSSHLLYTSTSSSLTKVHGNNNYEVETNSVPVVAEAPKPSAPTMNEEMARL